MTVQNFKSMRQAEGDQKFASYTKIHSDEQELQKHPTIYETMHIKRSLNLSLNIQVPTVAIITLQCW